MAKNDFTLSMKQYQDKLYKTCEELVISIIISHKNKNFVRRDNLLNIDSSIVHSHFKEIFKVMTQNTAKNDNIYKGIENEIADIYTNIGSYEKATLQSTKKGKDYHKEINSLSLAIRNLNCIYHNRIEEIPKFTDLFMKNNVNERWRNALRLIPKTEMPWSIFPNEWIYCFKMLATSCACSSKPILTSALAIISSCIGNKIDIQLKESWHEPLIIWLIYIANTGIGKTPLFKQLTYPLYEIQHEDGHKNIHIITETTMEALYNAFNEHPTKGILLHYDEMAKIITEQNQYKKKGSDSQNLLSLFTGEIISKHRMNYKNFVFNPRVSILGGMPPNTLKNTFNLKQDFENGLLPRFQIIYDKEPYRFLDRSEWTDEMRMNWKTIIKKSLEWSLQQKEKTTLEFTNSATDIFFNWRNELMSNINKFPKCISDTLPKTISYAARHAGAIYCFHKLANGFIPNGYIDDKYIKDGIKLSMYHLRQTLEYAIDHNDEFIFHDDPIAQEKFIISTALKNLRPHIDRGYLAIGLITDEYNRICEDKDNCISSAKLGRLLTKLELDKTTNKMKINNRGAVIGLIWNEKVENFLHNEYSNLTFI